MTRWTPEQIKQAKAEHAKKKGVEYSRYEKPPRKNFSAYLAPAVLEALKKDAADNFRSANSHLCFIVENYLREKGLIK
jgi:hypothetical protein